MPRRSGACYSYAPGTEREEATEDKPKSGGKHEGFLVYPIGDNLYINLTNRCTARCVFCPREDDLFIAGHDLSLDREPAAAEYLEAVGDPTRYAEIVFCGLGEPVLRLEALVEIAADLKRRGARVRLNTNGHGNLIHRRNIVPALASCLDAVSISIDAADPATYRKLVRPDFGDKTFEAVVEFTRECVARELKVTLTAVELRGLDLEPIRRLARDLGVEFRARPYEEELQGGKRPRKGDA